MSKIPSNVSEKERLCLFCGVLYLPKSNVQKYCSTRCAYEKNKANGDMEGEKVCCRCGEKKNRKLFAKQYQKADGRHELCNSCRSVDKKVSWNKHSVVANKIKATKHKENPSVNMLLNAKRNAKKANVPFSLVLEDIVIPEICPVLGINIFVGNNEHKDNSPSIDRLIPKNGYVKENIRIISYRANRIKNDASASELKLIFDYVTRETSNYVK